MILQSPDLDYSFTMQVFMYDVSVRKEPQLPKETVSAFITENFLVA